MDFISSTGFRGSYSFSCLLTLELDNFCFIQVDFVADGGFLLIIHIGFVNFGGFRGFRFLDPLMLHYTQEVSVGYRIMGLSGLAFVVILSLVL